MTKGEKTVRDWVKSNKWKMADFQEEMIKAYADGKSGLLNAPTGTGKTYGLLFPILIDHIDHHSKNNPGLQVLWITPLRALTKDLQRNIQQACDGMNTGWKIGIRTGDTTASEKTSQRKKMPELLLITPESLHLVLSQKNNSEFFKNLKAVVVDEWHELLGTKRGVYTELALSRLRHLVPDLRLWGISATIGNLEQALQVLTGLDFPKNRTAIIRSSLDKKVIVESILPDKVETLPWAGHLGIRLLEKIMPIILESKSSLLFTNTRSQTEIWYRSIMETYPELAGLIALHHGSIDREIRNWVEESLHNEKLKLVICTSSLDLGVDFRPVETVLQVGSPKSIARFLQRAGRSGHQPGSVSKIYFVPTHALELIEAVSLRYGVEKHVVESRVPVVQAFDVLAQYMVTMAVGEGFDGQQLYNEVKSTFAFQFLEKSEWKWLLGFITTGGPGLTAYDEFKKVERGENGLYVVNSRKIAMRHRLSMGTIVSDAAIQIKYRNGKYLGSIEEAFIARLKPGDVFSFAGMNLEILNVREMTVQVRNAGQKKGIVPSWQGGRIPLSSDLSAFIRLQLDHALEPDIEAPEILKLQPLLHIQEYRSAIPHHDQLLIEQFDTKQGHHIFIFPFEGRLVHEGMASLVAYRISKIKPVTFSMAMNDYGFELVSDQPIDIKTLLQKHDLFSTKNLLDDIQASVNSTELAKRKFREIAAIAGLTFQGYPGKAIKVKHLQASSSLLFDVISEHDPHNLLIRQSYQEAMDQQLEERRLRMALERIKKQEILFRYCNKPTPFAFPIMVDSMRDRVTSEKLEDRVHKLIRQLEKDGNQNKK